MKSFSWRTLAVSAALPVGVLAALLVLQDQRQGWPFSRHARVPAIQSASAMIVQGVASSAAARKAIDLPANQVETLGAHVETVKAAPIHNPVRAVATVVVDESRVVHVHTRVAGWLEALHVNTTGGHVRAGQALAGVFSQELYSSQSEYLSAFRSAASGPASVVLEASRTRLKLLGMSDAEITEIERTGAARRLVTVSAPKGGTVLNLGVTEGTAIDPSTEILTLADLSQLWVIAEVAEADAASIGPKTMAALTFPALRREPLAARVNFVYPTLTEGTRTIRVRFSIANPRGMLRPGMYGSVEFPGVSRNAISVKRDAVVDTGQSQHVFVVTSGNAFEPRPIKVGAQFADRVEVLHGLVEGERVVTSGVFLIDSESRLRASAGTGHAAHGAAAPSVKDAAAPAAPRAASAAKHGEHQR
jgi:Cu(I)/Ag(I) efflux system membrane fusion protein